MYVCVYILTYRYVYTYVYIYITKYSIPRQSLFHTYTRWLPESAWYLVFGGGPSGATLS